MHGLRMSRIPQAPGQSMSSPTIDAMIVGEALANPLHFIALDASRGVFTGDPRGLSFAFQPMLRS
jgi:hypothetical protein